MSRFFGALAIVTLVSSARAHDLGVSRSTLTERGDGSIHGQFTFAAIEAPNALDAAGHVAIDLRTDGEPCTAGTVVKGSETDSLVYDEDFACTRATTSIVATVGFLGRMGAAHENIASLEGYGDSANIASEFLSGEHRTITLELHRPKPKTSRVAFVVAAFVVAALVIAVAMRAVFRK